MFKVKWLPLVFVVIIMTPKEEFKCLGIETKSKSEEVGLEKFKWVKVQVYKKKFKL